MALTYASYLKIPELLRLQQPLSEGPEHDEMLFIVIHQVYELWFRQQIHEAERLRDRLRAGDGVAATGTLKRMLVILKTMVKQIDVLETMTPIDFLSFRARLENSSGFQSAQFREFEFLLGHKRRGPLGNYPAGTAERAALERRLEEPTIWEAFLAYLRCRGFEIPPEAFPAAPSDPTPSAAALHPILIGIYRTRPEERSLCELLVDLDEGIQEWRYRHVKMVERTIGRKPGTGGSPGVEYLVKTLFAPLFPDLWAIRADL
ncbi:MAG TPA: tryptophan 2,3-dioxygenase family protein [Phycisphaerales bacterium]|nr:tryptophan 2,3-dioxygenase family protein [Phycisphaerales bacterium]HMP36588.1 tryptophan 2,3-dioxygenase family protein [Phycisphaerales bacterium]